MKTISLKKIIVPSIPVAVILLLVIGLLWTLVFFNEGGFSVSGFSSTEFLSPNYFFTNLIIIGLTIANILLISQLVNRYSLIRTKTFLPVLIYLTTITAWDNTHTNYYPHLVLSLFMLALIFYFQMFRNPHASEQAFLGSLIMALGAILHPFILFMIPVVWIGFSMLQCLSLRTWLASVFGFLLPFFFNVFFQWYAGDTIVISQIFDYPLRASFLYLSAGWAENTYNILITIVLSIGLWGLLSNMNKDSIQSRSYLRFLLLFLFSNLMIIFVFAEMQSLLLPIVAMTASILVAHPFTVHKSPIYTYTFITYVAINILYVLLKPFFG